VQNKKQKRPIVKKLRQKNKQEVRTPIDLKETSIKRKIRPILEKVKAVPKERFYELLLEERYPPIFNNQRLEAIN